MSVRTAEPRQQLDGPDPIVGNEKRPDPLVMHRKGLQLRVRHDDERLTPYSPQVARIRTAVELASDVEGRRLVLETTMGERYRVLVRDDGTVVGLWQLTS